MRTLADVVNDVKGGSSATSATPEAPASPTLRGTHAIRHMLKRKDFRRLFGARLSAQFADGVFQASLAGAVLFNPQHASNAADLAASFAILLLPYSLIGPFAGVLLDQNSRARLMVWSNLIRAVLVLGVAVLVWSGIRGVPFFVLALIALSISRFFLSGLSASLPHVVDKHELVSANALTTTAGSVLAVIGGATAIGIRSLVGDGDHGYGLVAAAAAVGYVVGAWAISHFSGEELGPSDSERAKRTTAKAVVVGMWQGARHIIERRPTAAVLGAVSVHRFIFGCTTVAVLLLFKDYVQPDGFIRGGIAGVGQLLGAGALGALVGAVITPAASRLLGKPAWAALVLSVGGVLAMVLFLPFNAPLFLLSGFVLGFTGQASKVCADTIVQETMEEAYRGRVFCVYDTMFNVTFVLGIVTASFVLPSDGVAPLMFILCAVAYVLVGGCYRLAAVRGNFPR